MPPQPLGSDNEDWGWDWDSDWAGRTLVPDEAPRAVRAAGQGGGVGQEALGGHLATSGNYLALEAGHEARYVAVGGVDDMGGADGVAGAGVEGEDAVGLQRGDGPAPGVDGRALQGFDGRVAVDGQMVGELAQQLGVELRDEGVGRHRASWARDGALGGATKPEVLPAPVTRSAV